MATVYKKFTKKDMDTRIVVAPPKSDCDKINNILNNFVNYFKITHLS